MWIKIAKLILKFRLPLLLLILAITAFMAFQAKGIQMTYSFPKLIPENHEKFLDYQYFKENFGEDGNMMVIGLKTDRIFDRELFNDWFELGNSIKEQEGIEAILSIPHVFNVVKNQEEQKFDPVPILSQSVANDEEMDSIRQLFLSLPFYRNILYNPETNATLMGIRIERSLLDSKERVTLVENIVERAELFSQKHQTELHYSGLPYIRSFQVTKISKELRVFLLLASLLIAFILYFLFRSFPPLIFPMLVVTIGVIWSIGTMVLLGYKMSALTGLVPTLIVVIGIPNCVYLLNKYHEEFRKHGSRLRALTNMISRIGHVTFFANLTTAIGFGVFAFMESSLLREFGIVTGLNIAGTYIISMIVIPVIFSYLPNPRSKHLRHLDQKLLKVTLSKLVRWTSKYRSGIQLAMLGLIMICIPGLLQLESEGHLFDDVAEDAKEYKDLKFFENNFNGVMPFDILVDTRKKGGITKLSFMKKLNRVHKVFEEDTLFSKPLSMVDGVKFATQAYFNGKEKFYDLPSDLEKNFVFKYLANSGEDNSSLLSTLTDSNQQVARISVTMADVGSKDFPLIVEQLKPKVEAILDTSRYDITYTGTSLVALEGYNYLVSGLISSVLIAFFLISCIIAYLFRSAKMLVIALLPNIIPLVVTASIMGYLGISLKPSTVLVFSVAFGISVDFTIHFLAKYRQELNEYKLGVEDAITMSIQETGFSMIYTAIILFAGFIVFAGSEFTGTFYLGVLTSITLVVALFANLVLLPSIILTFQRWNKR